CTCGQCTEKVSIKIEQSDQIYKNMPGQDESSSRGPPVNTTRYQKHDSEANDCDCLECLEEVLIKGGLGDEEMDGECTYSNDTESEKQDGYQEEIIDRNQENIDE